ncbi:MAG: HemK/PrmC family methyltransferase, partial [Casimicrobiaceae bacterium]
MPTVGSTLAACGLERVDAEVLLSAVLGRNRAWLIAHATDALPAKVATSFAALAARRRNGEPVAYLTGYREFWGLSLAVDASVLIPRPETETLVEVALSRLPADRPAYVLDLGTGSGAIAVAVARERPLAVILATDSAAAALAVARANVN